MSETDHATAVSPPPPEVEAGSEAGTPGEVASVTEEARDSSTGDPPGRQAEIPDPDPVHAPEADDSVETAGDVASDSDAEAGGVSRATAQQASTSDAQLEGTGAEASAEAEEGNSQDEPVEDEAVLALRRARESGEPVEGTVIGWNNSGFHVAILETYAFCPRSEMEIGHPRKPASYVDRSFPFRVLRVRQRGRQVVVSRKALLEEELAEQKASALANLKPGKVVQGTVSSLTDFGAFVDLGGVEGLVHVSELSRDRVEHPKELLRRGEEVQVKVLKIEQGGDRISLSMRALQPDPWKELGGRLEVGSVLQGTVDSTVKFGAFINLAPGVTGLLPTSEMDLPRGSSPARAYPPGREVTVQVMQVDRRRHRISLAPEGAKSEGSRADYLSYRKSEESSEGFNALAAALRKIQQD